jgi:hypothetical protein
MILCITCDNVYHIRCSGINIKDVPESKLSWTCNLCITNPLNSATQFLVTSQQHKLAFDERIKYFIKEGKTEEQELSSESEAGGMDESVNVDRKGNPIPKEILMELSNIRAANELLKEQILEQTKWMAGILRNQFGSNINKTQIGKETPQVSVCNTIGFQETSYSNAILNANGASTHIVEELEQSQATIDGMIGSSDGTHPTTTDNRRVVSSDNSVDNKLRQLSKLTISELRRNLPNIEKFDGSPEKWLTFQRAVERNWKEGEYSSNEMRNQIRNEESKAKHKGNNYQVMTASTYDTSSHQATKNDDYKYEINDIVTAKYLGYYMKKVNQIPKRCEICAGTNHYSVERKAYRDMRMDERFNAVKTQGLCRNCLLTTTHYAKDCDVKNGCGFKFEENVRCTARHHISLHRASNNHNYNKSFKKQNRNFNTKDDIESSGSEAEEGQQQFEEYQQEVEEAELPDEEDESPKDV